MKEVYFVKDYAIEKYDAEYDSEITHQVTSVTHALINSSHIVFIRKNPKKVKDNKKILDIDYRILLSTGEVVNTTNCDLIQDWKKISGSLESKKF